MPGNILIVDDSIADVELLMLVLKRLKVPHHIDAVHTGKDAILRLAETPTVPALILVDVRLPDLSGFEVLRVLRADQRFKAVPTVMLTGIEAAGEQAKAYAIGANAFLIKPLAITEFQHAIDDIAKTWLS